MNDADKIARELLATAKDPNEFIGTVTSINQNGTVNVKRKDGTSVNAIASSLNTGVLAYVQKVEGEWYASVAHERQQVGNQTILKRRSHPQPKIASSGEIFLAYAIALEGDSGNYEKIEFWVMGFDLQGKKTYKEKIHEEDASKLIYSDAITKDYIDTSLSSRRNKHDVGIVYSSGRREGQFQRIGEKVIYRHNQTTIEIPADIEQNFLGNAFAPRLVSASFVGMVPSFYSGAYLRQGVYEKQLPANTTSDKINYVKQNQISESTLSVSVEYVPSVTYAPVRAPEFVLSSASLLPNAFNYYDQIPPEIDPNTQTFYALISNGPSQNPPAYANSFNQNTGTRSWQYIGTDQLFAPWRWRKFPSTFPSYQNQGGIDGFPKYSVNHDLEIIPGVVVTNTLSELITVEGERYSEATSPSFPGDFGGYFRGIRGYTLLHSIISDGI